MRDITGFNVHYFFGGIFLLKILHAFFDFFVKKFTPLSCWNGSALLAEPSDDLLESMY